MRVAFVLGQNAGGGTELQARALIRELGLAGVHVDVFLLDAAAGASGLPDDTIVLAHGRPRGARAVLAYVEMTYRLRQHLRRGGYSVAHSAMARGYTLMAIASLGLPGLRRVTWRRNLGVHVQGRWRHVMRLVERLVVRQADHVVSNSEDVAHFWRGFAGGAPEKHVVIPNILERWRFEQVPPVVPPGEKIRVVSVGALKAVKGHDLLVQAVAGDSELRANVEVVLVGEGPERSALATRSSAAGVDLRLTGAVPDPRGWLSGADIYVQPSLSEGSSNAVAEAMAAGLPVLAFQVGGMRELVGDAGVLVERVDAGALAGALRALMSDPDERARLGAAAQQRMASRSGPEEVVERYLRLYGASRACAE
ncbi:glycosyltransferase [Nocardioides sp.]|uniref:glycosyltransferase n=1 Tax=Nocardioides sp. TaxID=35761 RepID=UPI0035699D68